VAAVRHIDIAPEFAGQRIDNFLLRELKGLPKTRVYRLLRKGEVRVNGGRARPGYRLQTGDRLRLPPVRLAEREVQAPSSRIIERLEGAILHEDEEILVIDKPSGMAVHGGSGLAYGVVEALRAMRPGQKFLDLAHRLDRDTSGCLVLAKRRNVLQQLHEQLRSGAVTKRYLALLHGRMPRGPVPVEEPLERQRGRGGESVVRVSAAGKPSRTVFTPLERFSGWTLVEADLQTGRMHQIRVHARHLGHPVAGDSKYGDDAANAELRQIGLRRLFLHAATMRFQVGDGREVEVTAPLPEALQGILDSLSKGSKQGEGSPE
jgi:23S rRNA pseudouridine955/2504/2580 synthase